VLSTDGRRSHKGGGRRLRHPTRRPATESIDVIQRRRRPGVETTGAGAGQIGEIGTASVPPGGDAPTVLGLVYGPAGRRRWYLVLVERCHWCTGAHHHHTPWPPSGVLRRSCPTWGRRYVIAPRAVDTSRRRRGGGRRGA
jgi:hypothetical protein